MRLVYIVTYDISHPKRLRQVYSLMRGYGDHLQLSVFRCELTPRERVELLSKLTGVVKHDEDQVLLFPLGPVEGMKDTSIYSVGRPYTAPNRGAVVI
jgi:CRISPR-associated protein Cas2